ncbi:hypothetical protein SAMN04487897_102903 [Paenibacillus sp. yr247]|nr:hypothetical protein SAMN04487897_102903 [Paenibacillus sp. yr247]
MAYLSAIIAVVILLWMITYVQKNFIEQIRLTESFSLLRGVAENWKRSNDNLWRLTLNHPILANLSNSKPFGVTCFLNLN